jgi:hypothetical protein
MQENKSCLNCDTKLEGRFCYLCGQKHINPNVTVKQLLHQFTEEFFTFDNRFYKTLKPLMLSPGKVTMDYNSGKRARYMPLLKLYLFVSFTLFLLMPYGTVVNINVNNAKAAAQPPLEKAAAQPQLENKVEPQPEPKSKTKGFLNWLGDKISSKNPETLRKEIIAHFPQMMFLLMPFLALLLKIFYRRNDNLYTHHLVFSLHFHTFTFILFIVIILSQITRVALLAEVMALLILFVPWYLYRGMKEISGQSGMRTVTKTGAILFIYWFVSMICMAALILVTIILS